MILGQPERRAGADQAAAAKQDNRGFGCRIPQLRIVSIRMLQKMRMVLHVIEQRNDGLGKQGETTNSLLQTGGALPVIQNPRTKPSW